MVKKKKAQIDERFELIWRILVGIVTGIILEIWGILVLVVAVVNWVLVLIEGKRNKDLAMFCEYFNTEMYRYYRYLTLVSNDRPFPFSEMQQLSKFEK